MFNRANEGLIRRFRRTTATATVEGRHDTDHLEARFPEREAVLHVLWTDSGIEHEADERTTTVEPGGNTAACAVVTDRQVVAQLGEVTEFAADLTAVEHAGVSEHLLSTTFEAGTGTETVRFTPVDVGEAEAAARTIDEVRTAWADLDDALSVVRSTFEDLERLIVDGRDPATALNRARGHVADAHRCATREEALPTDRMEETIEPVEETLDELEVRARTAFVESRLDDVESARDDGSYRDAAETYVAATTTVATAERAVASASSLDDEFVERVDDVAARAREQGEALLGDALSACERAREVDDPADVMAGWATARERYRSLLDAGWTDQAGIDATAIRYQLAWVVGREIDALAAHARVEETAGDHGDGDETQRFETAKVALSRARDLAAEHAYADPDCFDDPLDRVADKHERSKWQWGRAEA